MKKENSGSSKIENCKAYSKKQNGAKAFGGAVYIKGKSTFILHESTIHDCTAIGLDQGGSGGVGNGGGTFDMQEGSIISNCSSSKEPSGMGNNGLSDGGAVYVTYQGKFYMSGSATVTPSTSPDQNVKGKNDIYLASGATASAKITIRETLTPQNYSSGTQVLDGVITAGNPPNYKKFEVTPNGGTQWYVSSTGSLTTTEP